MASVTSPMQSELTFEDALEALSREGRFMATVSAMNSLLIEKGVYTTEEFQHVFVEWAAAEISKSTRDRSRR